MPEKPKGDEPNRDESSYEMDSRWEDPSKPNRGYIIGDWPPSYSTRYSMSRRRLMSRFIVFLTLLILLSALITYLFIR